MKECRSIAELIGAYIYGDLSPEEMRRVRKHAASCSDCEAEIAARSRAVSLIPNGVPHMSDEERLRVMWAVKGAVRAKSECRRFGFFSYSTVKGVAVAAVVVAAFTAGAVYGPRIKYHQTVAEKPAIEKPAPAEEPDHNIVETPTPPVSEPVAPPQGMMTALDPFNRYEGVSTSRGWFGEIAPVPEDETADAPAEPSNRQTIESPLEAVLQTPGIINPNEDAQKTWENMTTPEQPTENETTKQQ